MDESLVWSMCTCGTGWRFCGESSSSPGRRRRIADYGTVRIVSALHCGEEKEETTRTVVEDDDARGSGKLLDEVDGLGIVFLLDHFVVLEGCVGHGAPEELETGGVERDGVLLPTDVLDVGTSRNRGPVSRTLASGSIGIDADVGLGAIWRRGEVVEGDGYGICGGHGHLENRTWRTSFESRFAMVEILWL